MVFRMTDAGYYRGTTADQDTRFGDKTKKLMKTLKFSDQLNEPVDMRKVKNFTVQSLPLPHPCLTLASPQPEFTNII